MRSFSHGLRIVSWALVVTFIAQDILWAAPDVALSNPFAISHPIQIDLSSRFVRVGDVYKAQTPGAKTLIHIQDAHTNSGAQKNIAGVLEELVTRHGVKTIFIEGGTQDDSLDFLRPAASKLKREQVAQKHLMRGEISGAEYLSLSSDLDFKLQGVEDKALYWKNVKLYAEVVKHRETVLSYVGEIQQNVDSLKRRLFPKDLVAYDDFLKAFRKKEKDFTEYHALLTEKAQTYHINMLGFPHFASLKELKTREEKIDFRQANLEVEKLTREVSPNDISAHAQKIKSGAESPLAVYEGLLESAREKNTDVSSYGQFLAYVEYLRLYEHVNMDRLLKETEILEEIVYQKALTDEDAFYLHRLDGYLGILKNLFNLQATRDEVDRYLLLQKDMRFNTKMLLGFVNRKLCDLNRWGDVIPWKSTLDDHKNEVEDFYRTTLERDSVFIQKSLDKMKKENIQTAVLITGGYHTPNLKEALREKNISYIVAAPLVTEETNMKRYEEILLADLGDENPLKNLKQVNGRKNSSYVTPVALEESLRLGPVEEALGIAVAGLANVGAGLVLARGDDGANLRMTGPVMGTIFKNQHGDGNQTRQPNSDQSVSVVHTNVSSPSVFRLQNNGQNHTDYEHNNSDNPKPYRASLVKGANKYGAKDELRKARKHSRQSSALLRPQLDDRHAVTLPFQEKTVNAPTLQTAAARLAGFMPGDEVVDKDGNLVGVIQIVHDQGIVVSVDEVSTESQFILNETIRANLYRKRLYAEADATGSALKVSVEGMPNGLLEDKSLRLYRLTAWLNDTTSAPFNSIIKADDNVQFFAPAGLTPKQVAQAVFDQFSPRQELLDKDQMIELLRSIPSYGLAVLFKLGHSEKNDRLEDQGEIEVNHISVDDLLRDNFLEEMTLSSNVVIRLSLFGENYEAIFPKGSHANEVRNALNYFRELKNLDWGKLSFNLVKTSEGKNPNTTEIYTLTAVLEEKSLRDSGAGPDRINQLFEMPAVPTQAARLADLDQAIQDITGWKVGKSVDELNTVGTRYFRTQLQQKALEIAKQHSLYLLTPAERIRYAQAVFDESNFPVVYEKVSMLASMVSEGHIPMEDGRISPRGYVLLARQRSDEADRYSSVINRNIRVADNIVFDITNRERSLLEAQDYLDQADQEFDRSKPQGDIPLTVTVQDIHGGSRRLLALIGFAVGLPNDVFANVRTLDELKQELSKSKIDPSKLNVRFVGFNDLSDRGNNPREVYEIVRWLGEMGKLKHFAGNHDDWRAFGGLGIHEYMLRAFPGFNYDSPRQRTHHIAHWAREAFAHTGWGDVELDQINQERINAEIRRVHEQLTEGERDTFKEVDLAAIRTTLDEEVRQAKEKNDVLRRAGKKEGFVTLPNVFERTLDHLRSVRQDYNKRLRAMGIQSIEFDEVNLDNFWYDREVAKQTLWELQHFRLYYVDAYGILHIHNTLPMDERGAAVDYERLEGLAVLDLYSDAIRDRFMNVSLDEMVDGLKDPEMKFIQHIWEELGPKLKEINDWYSDRVGDAKGEAYLEFATDPSARRRIFDQIEDNDFVDRKPYSFIVMGHNPRKKIAKDGPWIYLDPLVGSGAVFIDEDLSQAYENRGAVLMVGGREKGSGVAMGVQRYGYRASNSQVIEDMTFDDINGLDRLQIHMLQTLHGGKSFYQWRRSQLLKQMLSNLERLKASAETSHRQDKLSLYVEMGLRINGQMTELINDIGDAQRSQGIDETIYDLLLLNHPRATEMARELYSSNIVTDTIPTDDLVPIGEFIHRSEEALGLSAARLAVRASAVPGQGPAAEGQSGQVPNAARLAMNDDLGTLRSSFESYLILPAEKKMKATRGTGRVPVVLQIRKADGLIYDNEWGLPNKLFEGSDSDAELNNLSTYFASLINVIGMHDGATHVYIGSPNAGPLKGLSAKVRRKLNEDFGSTSLFASFGKRIVFARKSLDTKIKKSDKKVAGAANYKIEIGLGFDLGGSSIKIASRSKKGGKIKEERVERKHWNKPNGLADLIIKNIEAIYGTEHAKDVPVVVAVPGPVSPAGKIIAMVNLEKLREGTKKELDDLQRRYPNIIYQNDANTMAQNAVVDLGLSNGLVAFNTVGTGIGYAVIEDGKLGQGPMESHIRVDFTLDARPNAFGMNGDLESYANEQYVVNRVNEELSATGSLENVKSAREVVSWFSSDLDSNNRKIARKIFGEVGENLFVLYRELSHLRMNNQLTSVLSGGMVMDDGAFREIRRGIQKAKRKYNGNRGIADKLRIRVRRANDPGYAGAIGALYLGIQATVESQSAARLADGAEALEQSQPVMVSMSGVAFSQTQTVNISPQVLGTVATSLVLANPTTITSAGDKGARIDYTLGGGASVVTAMESGTVEFHFTMAGDRLEAYQVDVRMVSGSTPESRGSFTVFPGVVQAALRQGENPMERLLTRAMMPLAKEAVAVTKIAMVMPVAMLDLVADPVGVQRLIPILRAWEASAIREGRLLEIHVAFDSQEAMKAGTAQVSRLNDILDSATLVFKPVVLQNGQMIDQAVDAIGRKGVKAGETKVILITQVPTSEDRRQMVLSAISQLGRPMDPAVARNVTRVAAEAVSAQNRAATYNVFDLLHVALHHVAGGNTGVSALHVQVVNGMLVCLADIDHALEAARLAAQADISA